MLQQNAEQQVNPEIKRGLILDYQRLLEALASKYTADDLEAFLAEQSEAIQQNAIIQERKWLKHLRSPEYIKTCRIPSKFPQPSHVFQLHKSFNIVPNKDDGTFNLLWDPTCILQDTLLYTFENPKFTAIASNPDWTKDGVNMVRALVFKALDPSLATGFCGFNQIPLKDFQSIRLTGAAIKMTYFGRQDAAKGLIYYGQMPYAKSPEGESQLGSYGAFFTILQQTTRNPSGGNKQEYQVIQEAEKGQADIVAGEWGLENSFVLSSQGIENLYHSTIKKATSGLRVIWLPLSEQQLQYLNTMNAKTSNCDSFMHYIRGEGLSKDEGAVLHIDMYTSYEAIPISNKREIYAPIPSAPGDYNHQAQLISQLSPII